MADTLRVKRRAAGGASGPPTSLAGAEIAFNEQDNVLYYGKGNSAGLATSIIPIAGPGSFLPLAGGDMTGGVTFGSVTSPSGNNADLSRHIALWGTGTTGGAFGFGITNARLNYNVAGGSAHVVMVNAVDKVTINALGLSMAANTDITLIRDPTSPTHAATMQYVDGAVTRAGGPFLRLTGGTVAGATTFSSGGVTFSGASGTAIAAQITANTTVGLDTTTGIFSGPAIRLATAQALSFTAASNRLLYYSASAPAGLKYGTGSVAAPGPVMTFGDDGTVTAGTITAPVGTFGTLTIVPPAGQWAVLAIQNNGPSSATAAQIGGFAGSASVAANTRWVISLPDQITESAGDNGANFRVNRFSNTGVFIDTPFGITRSTGALFGTGVTALLSSINYTAPYTGAVARAAASKFADLVSVKDFGAVGDGSHNDTTMIQAAFNSGARAIYFPAGTYLCSAQLNYTLSTTLTGVTIFGDGAEVTKLRFLGNISGIYIQTHDAHNSVTVKGLTFMTDVSSGTTQGLTLQGPNAFAGADTAPSYVEDCIFRGTLGYNNATNAWWAYSLVVINVSNTTIVNCFFTAPNGSGTGVYIAGNSTSIPCVFYLTDCVWTGMYQCVFYGDYVQGIFCSQCTAAGNNYFLVASSGETGLDQLTVTASQFESANACFVIQSTVANMLFQGNLFYVDAPNGLYCIQCTASTSIFTISGNIFARNGVFSSSSIAVDFVGADTPYGGCISGNSFVAFNTGIVLGTGTRGITVHVNSYWALPNNVVDAGTANNVIVP